MRQGEQRRDFDIAPGDSRLDSDTPGRSAIAQMGVHLVFFLHVTTGPEGVNNIMAIAFGVLICLLLISGSLWIMGHLNHNMVPMAKIMQMQR